MHGLARKMDGGWRAIAAGCWSIVHFMHQPLYNSLIAKYSPRRRRSLCYGFSFAMGFGIGSTAAALVGFTHQQFFAFALLAGIASVATVVGVVLARRQSPTVPA